MLIEFIYLSLFISIPYLHTVTIHRQMCLRLPYSNLTLSRQTLPVFSKVRAKILYSRTFRETWIFSNPLTSSLSQILRKQTN